MALKKSQKSLKKWTSQKWDYLSKGDKDKPKKKRGRYLPKSVRESLTSAQRAYENRKKRKASKAGKQRASYSKSVRKKMRGK
tara:strand:- start:1898 stop:2143 length:246 start_codon:yes stop_codon:yes gene_type:complete